MQLIMFSHYLEALLKIVANSPYDPTGFFIEIEAEQAQEEENFTLKEEYEIIHVSFS